MEEDLMEIADGGPMPNKQFIEVNLLSDDEPDAAPAQSEGVRMNSTP